MQEILFDIKKNDSYQLLNWDAQDRTFTGELSTLQGNVEGYDNRIIKVRVKGSGNIRTFIKINEYRDREGEIQSFIFEDMAGTGIKIIVFND